MISRNLICSVEFGGEFIEVEVQLTQSDDCSISASMLIENDSIDEGNEQIYIESVQTAGMLMLRRSRGIICERDLTIIPGSEVDSIIEAALLGAELEMTPTPSIGEIVMIRIYVTNLPYFRFSNNYSINIGGYTFRITPHIEGAITNFFEVQDIPYGSITSVLQTAESLCWLSSFAGGCLASIPRVEVFQGDELLYLSMRAVDTSLSRAGTLIYEDPRSSNITQFLEYCFDYYQQNSNIYLINNLINIGVLAKHTPYIENKILLMCNFLEILRFNYAQNVCVPNGTFNQRNNDFVWVNGSNAGQKASFREILVDFLTTNGINGWDGDFVDIRNEIVHTGCISRDSIERYYNLHHFCDRIILALLQWDQTTGNYIPINCPNDPTPGVVGVNNIVFNR